MSTPPSAGSHERDASAVAIEGHSQVQLLGDAASLLDIDLADLLTVVAGLGSLQHHPEHGLGVLPRLVRGAREPDAAALSSTAGVDLRLHGRDTAAQLASRALRLERGHREVTARHSDAKFPEDLFRLVLVDLHVVNAP